MSQPTTKQTGRRTPQTKPKIPKDLAEGSMVVSVSNLDKITLEKLIETPKAVAASPKKEAKESKAANSPAEKVVVNVPEAKAPTEGAQNGSTSEKKATNGVNSEKTEEVTNGEGKVRESPRQKAAKEAEKKKEVAEVEKKEAEAKSELNASTASTMSLAKEKELKGFKDNGDEMASIVLQPDEVSGALFDSPRPNKTPGKGLKGVATPNRARISPFRKSERLQNVSTAVNLSTVSEQSNEVAPSPPVDQSFGSLRHVSGRRSFSNRPLREFTFQNAHRESYRKLPEAYDDSISSVNATVGSEIHSDSFRTPIVASVKGRKRELTPHDSDDDIRIVDKTPGKRARLDLSAFLGFMASPVTLLRNKFQRANIQSSTPNQSFVVEELGKDAGDKEVDLNCSKEQEKSVELGEEPKDGPEGVSEDLELLKEKVEDIEMKTPAQGRRACVVM
ncbi:neurofilament heavy polypeptide-like [Phlebotomus argentipes]|uniref:neurofilament heavy polypeptide-like n=1 Tax=Phlebotomus argentipes TaxID=94469 RepID=UPI002893118C|nr:neurofilament heavy polypeptide-like [Phlebotomus argentipes]